MFTVKGKWASSGARLRTLSTVLLYVMLLMSLACRNRGPADVTAIEADSFANSLCMKMVSLSTGYYVPRDETTQGQFKEVMHYDPSRSRRPDKPLGMVSPETPVEMVSAWQAEEFCIRLTESEAQSHLVQAGYAYALPTFEQWKQYFADSPIQRSVSPYGKNPKWTEKRPLPVGSGETNRLGIRDLRGNVGELCADLYDARTGGRVVKGGSFATFRKDEYNYPYEKAGVLNSLARSFDIGFRCVLTKKRAAPSSVTGDTLLHRSALKNEGGAVRAHIAAGSDVNARNRWGDTPLHRAALGGGTAVLTALLDAGAAVNARNEKGILPLHYAIYAEESDAALLLLARGADVNAEDPWGDAPLFLSVRFRLPSVALALLHRGAKVDVPSGQGFTPLMEAAAAGQNGLVGSLIEAGADVNARSDRGGWTALELATKNGHQQVAAMLRGHEN